MYYYLFKLLEERGYGVMMNHSWPGFLLAYMALVFMLICAKMILKYTDETYRDDADHVDEKNQRDR